MRIEVLPDEEAVARAAAAWLAAAARAAVAARGKFLLAVSGGRTPERMFSALAAEEMPWDGVHLFQTDERAAPDGHPERNLTRIRGTLLSRGDLVPAQVHAMPAESPDLDAGAAEYARDLEEIAGSPVVLDVVHLGLGADGHTASLFPGDPFEEDGGRDVLATGVHAGWRRLSLGFPVLARARALLWLVTGEGKREALSRWVARDPSIPAGRLPQEHAVLFADAAAAGGLGP